MQIPQVDQKWKIVMYLKLNKQLICAARISCSLYFKLTQQTFYSQNKQNSLLCEFLIQKHLVCETVLKQLCTWNNTELKLVFVFNIWQ